MRVRPVLLLAVSLWHAAASDHSAAVAQNTRAGEPVDVAGTASDWSWLTSVRAFWLNSHELTVHGLLS
jgi:hypothetical protein